MSVKHTYKTQQHTSKYHIQTVKTQEVQFKHLNQASPSNAVIWKVFTDLNIGLNLWRNVVILQWHQVKNGGLLSEMNVCGLLAEHVWMHLRSWPTLVTPWHTAEQLSVLNQRIYIPKTLHCIASVQVSMSRNYCFISVIFNHSLVTLTLKSLFHVIQLRFYLIEIWLHLVVDDQAACSSLQWHQRQEQPSRYVLKLSIGSIN